MGGRTRWGRSGFKDWKDTTINNNIQNAYKIQQGTQLLLVLIENILLFCCGSRLWSGPRLFSCPGWSSCPFSHRPCEFPRLPDTDPIYRDHVSSRRGGFRLIDLVVGPHFVGRIIELLGRDLVVDVFWSGTQQWRSCFDHDGGGWLVIVMVILVVLEEDQVVVVVGFG